MEFLAEIYSKVTEIESMIKSRGYSDRIMSAVVFGLIEDSNLEDEDGMVNVRSLFSYNLDSKEELETIKDIMDQTYEDNPLDDLLGDLGIRLN